MRQSGLCRVLLCFSLCAFAATSRVLAAPGVDTFVLAVGGQSKPADPNPPPFACTTYGVPAPAAMFGANGVLMPVEGYPACSIAGGFRTLAAPAGPVADATALDVDFHNFDNDQFTGSSAAKADYGRIGAAAFGHYTATPGNTDPIVEGAEAFGHFQDTLTITSPSRPAGAQGYVVLTFSVDGRVTTNGASVARLEVDEQLNGGALDPVLAAGMAGTGDQPFISAPNSFGGHTGPGTWGGFTLSTDSLVGSGAVPGSYLSFVFGTPFDLGAVVFVYTTPRALQTASIDFGSTVRLTGIQVFDAGFTPVATFAVASGSGTLYDAAGAHTPPDPFAVVATSGSPLPGGNEPLATLPTDPCIGADRTGFLGLGVAGQQGVYAGGTGAPVPPPIKVADLTTAIPGGSGLFTGFGALSLTASSVMAPNPPPIRLGFVGSGPAQQGIYLGDVTDPTGATPPNPIKVVDLSTAIPGGSGTFSGFAGISLATLPVAAPTGPPIIVGFTGSGAGQQGVYLADVTDLTGGLQPPPIKIADLSTAIPGGAGSFSGFGGIALATLPVASPEPPPIRAALVGSGSGQQGIYLSTVTSPTGGTPPDPIKVADLSTAIPGGAGNFTGFDQLAATLNPVASPTGPPIRLAFIGTGDGQQGVYLYDVTDPTGAVPPSPIKVADLTTSIPGGTGNFTGFSALSVSHEHTAFLGQGSGGQIGLYVASTLTKVVAVGDTLEGKAVTALRLGREGLDGDRLAFAADFTDGSTGLFTYSLPPSAAETGPGSIDDSLRVAPSHVTPGDLTLSWSASCSANAIGYAVYEGTIGQWYSHVARSCSASGPGLSDELTPSAGNRYYLVVPLGVNGEGSYGRASNGTEIPPASGAVCMAAQVLGPCP
jgi:hypothetical protein